MSTATLTIGALEPIDRARWGVLASGYKTFYETEVDAAGYEQAWQRLREGDGVHGLGARLDGRLVGIAHFLFHANVWMAAACHLQDLYVDETMRGRGVARALIEGVASLARQRGAARLYWHTRANNVAARTLYDKVARHDGFVRYDYPMAAPPLLSLGAAFERGSRDGNRGS